MQVVGQFQFPQARFSIHVCELKVVHYRHAAFLDT